MMTQLRGTRRGDVLQWDILRIRVDERSGAGRDYIADPAYYPTMESLLKCLPNRMALDNSVAATLAELKEEFRRYHPLIENE